MKNMVKAGLAVTLVVGLGACANTASRHGPLMGYSPQVDSQGYPSNLRSIDRPTVADFMQNRREDLEEALASEIASKRLSISQSADGSIKINVPSDENFDKASSVVKSRSTQTFGAIAREIVKFRSVIIHVVGHTDSEGDDDYNQELSDARAAAVGEVMSESIRNYWMPGSDFRGSGLHASRIHETGRGEREPIATNETVAGQTLNRRVDIILKPVIETRESEAEVLGSTLGYNK